MKRTNCDTLPYYLAVPLDAFSNTAVSGAYLQYGGTRLFDSPLNVTLTVGANERVYCVQATGAHFNRVVQPTRPTGVDGPGGWSELTSCWWW